jgi:hypothetical protein
VGGAGGRSEPLARDSALGKMESPCFPLRFQTATAREYGDMKSARCPAPHVPESIECWRAPGEGHAGRLRRVHQTETTPQSGRPRHPAPGNLPLYQHFGYEVTDETSMGNVPVWFMFRPNQERPGDKGAAGAGRQPLPPRLPRRRPRPSRATGSAGRAKRIPDSAFKRKLLKGRPPAPAGPPRARPIVLPQSDNSNPISVF